MRSRELKRAYLSLLRKVRLFLLSDQCKEIFIFLFFFMVAAAFWLLQTLDSEYEADFSIPVKLRDVPDNIVVTTDIQSEVQVRIRDKGTVLLNYKVAKRFYPLSVDFTEHQTKGHHVVLNASTLLADIGAQLAASSAIVSVKPDTVDYFFTEGVGKKVPVQLRGKVSGGRQYFVSDTILAPDSVTVYAEVHALDTISCAFTEPVDFSQIEDTLNTSVKLSATRGVKFVPSNVKLQLPVDIYTEKTVEVPIEAVNFPADKAFRAFPSKIQVTFQTGLSRYKDITAEDFHIIVTYEELLKLGSDKLSVKLKNTPEGVSSVRFSPSQIDFLIEQTSTTDAN